MISKDKRGIWVAAAAILIGLGGITFRLWATIAGAPPPNSDEATFGLAALHVLQGKHYPVFMYGQHYMGTLESYAAAPVILAMGSTTFALRTATLLFYVLFLVAMYFMTKKIYSGGMALFTVAVLALGSDRVVKDQLIADGSAELAVMATVLMLLATALGVGHVRHPRLLVAAWGLLGGFAFWDHMLVLPYLASSAVVLMLNCSHIIRRQAVVVASGAFLLGASPLIVHNLMLSRQDNFLSVLLHYNTVGSDAPLLDRLYGGILLGIPLATGICEPSNCQPWQMAWGPIYIGLMITSALLAVRTIRRASGPDRATAMARLALVVGAFTTIVLYARSPAAADTPIESVRYLALLLVSSPAVVWPLWTMMLVPKQKWRRVLLITPLFLIIAAMTSATIAFAGYVPTYARQTAQQQELIRTMHELGISRFYTVYWTCNRLAYASGEKAVCAVLDDDLRPGFNRYGRYTALVGESDSPAYIAPIGSTFDANVARFLRQNGNSPEIIEVAGYNIYIPDRPLHPSANW